jgi:hypothetical protein
MDKVKYEPSTDAAIRATAKRLAIGELRIPSLDELSVQGWVSMTLSAVEWPFDRPDDFLVVIESPAHSRNYSHVGINGYPFYMGPCIFFVNDECAKLREYYDVERAAVVEDEIAAKQKELDELRGSDEQTR